jgi:hypothetical protein
LDVSDNGRNVPSRENKEEKKRIKRGKKVICCPQQPFEGVAKRHPSSQGSFTELLIKILTSNTKERLKRGKRRRLKKRENQKRKPTPPKRASDASTSISDFLFHVSRAPNTKIKKCSVLF